MLWRKGHKQQPSRERKVSISGLFGDYPVPLLVLFRYRACSRGRRSLVWNLA